MGNKSDTETVFKTRQKGSVGVVYQPFLLSLSMPNFRETHVIGYWGTARTMVDVTKLLFQLRNGALFTNHTEIKVI